MARFNTADSVNTQYFRGPIISAYNTPGANTWTVPTGVNCVTFEIWGAGGGGGAKCCCECYHQGSGGSSGNYASITVPVVAGQSYALCVGAGGMYTESGNSSQHSCCYGGDGGFTSVTGPSITTLCAGGGVGGVNNCYLYCLCTSPYTRTTICACAVSPNTNFGLAYISCAISGGSSCQTGGGCSNLGSGTIGMWTDSIGQYYKSATGGVPWGSSTVNTVNWCYAPATSNSCFAQTGCSMGGQAGQGAFLTQCCQCARAGTGSNGLILIRY